MLTALLGCGATPPRSEPQSAAPAKNDTKPARRERWPLFEEVAAWPEANPQPIRSRGHGAGEYEMTIRISPSARDPYIELGGAAELPVGTVVAAFHRNVRQAQPGPVFVMEKKDGGWRYLAFDPRGFAAEHGVLSLCERCHRESPSGALFGLPRGMRPPE